LLKQPRIVIKDAETHLAATNCWTRRNCVCPRFVCCWRTALVATALAVSPHPTAAAARRLELRGDLNGRSLQAPESWSGQVYARVDDARFESWGRWVPWAQDAVRKRHSATCASG
jgi:hypothetical protein